MVKRPNQNNQTTSYASTRLDASPRTARGGIDPLPLATDGWGRGFNKIVDEYNAETEADKGMELYYNFLQREGKRYNLNAVQLALLEKMVFGYRRRRRPKKKQYMLSRIEAVLITPYEPGLWWI